MVREEFHIHWLNRNRVFILIISVGVLLIASCNPAKRLAKGQYLLIANNIIYRSLQPAKAAKSKLINNKLTEIPQSEIAKLVLPPELAVNQLLNYIKQKPNTKILGLFPLPLYEYNLVDQEKTREKRVIKNNKIDEKNRKIEEDNVIRKNEGKSLKPYKSKDPGTFSGEWLMSVGEAPVILDSILMTGSVDQITKYLHTKGYFDGKVTDSVHVVDSNRADVFYIVQSGSPYKVNKVTYQLDDTTLAPIVYKDSVNSLINNTDNFDEDVLKSERDRITKVLKDDGYYSFSKEYIEFEVDTNKTTKEVAITIGIKKFAFIDPAKPDSVIESLHHQYFIRNVTIQMNYNPNMPNYDAADTVSEKGYTIVSPKGEMDFLPKILLSKVYIKPGDMFQISNVENTYGGLSQMKEFRYVNIRWVVSKDSSKLDCYIQLMPNTKLSFAAELVGDNTGGDWGGQADVTYQNNNLLKGAEVLQVKFKYSIQAQTLLGSESPTSDIVTKSLLFNTIDIGPDVSLAVPRPLNVFNGVTNLFNLNPAIANPQTVLKASYDFQERPDYQRDILTLGYGYDFNFTKYQHINITLFEVNYVNAVNSQEFEDALIATNDFFLLNSFTTHAITDFRVSWLLNNQALTKLRNFDYLKLTGECSGILIRQVDQLLNQPDKIAGIAYSHYLKGDLDWRHYFVISKDDKVATRIIIGAGIPLYDNSGQQLPFDKSFWVGGSNDIRAWAARTLGPGANNQFVTVEQIGDIKIEGNAEYRVNLIKFFGLAFFVDAGNVWLMNKNPSIPHGEFELEGQYAFYNEFAVGAGTGFRFDFTYFVFRFDLGWQLLNPAMPPESWHQIHETAQFDKPALNIGIGYPF